MYFESLLIFAHNLSQVSPDCGANSVLLPFYYFIAFDERFRSNVTNAPC